MTDSPEAVRIQWSRLFRAFVAADILHEAYKGLRSGCTPWGWGDLKKTDLHSRRLTQGSKKTRTRKLRMI